MVDSQPVDDTKYAGPSRTVEILGTGNAYGWIGSIAGLIAGGVMAVLSTKESSKLSQHATELFKKVNWHINGRTAVVVGGALAGSQILHYVGVIIGLRRGADMAGQGEKQFERVKARCDVLKDELAAVKAERTQHQDEFHKDQNTAAAPATVVNTITRDVANVAPAQAHASVSVGTGH